MERDGEQKRRVVKAVAAFVLFAALEARAAPLPSAQREEPDPLLERVEAILSEAQRAIRAFQNAGGKNDDPRHPVDEWVRTLWRFREEHPGTRAAGRAVSEALHLLVHAERFERVRKETDALSADDPAWERLPGVLVEAAALENDYSYVLEKLRSLAEEPAAQRFRAGVLFQLGRALRALGEEEPARATIERALELEPDAAWAASARELVYELSRLAIGQPAPAVVARARDGSRIALEAYRGEAVLLIFWSST